MNYELDYRTYGDPALPALTLLHAGAFTYHEWDPFIEAWSKRFHCIAATALGHGSSPSVASLRFPDLVASTLRLLDSLGIAKTHLLGSSMGGATALHLVTAAPERVDRLILYRCSHRNRASVSESLAAMEDPETWRRWGLEGTLRTLHDPQGGPEAWRTVVRRVRELVEAEDPSIARSDAALRSIASPTMVICGDRDPLVPLEDAVSMYRTIPRAALWVVPNATHLIGAETIRRPAFEQEVVRFLTQKLS
jgi:3-oxoadipate enol-lactonase